MDPKLFSISDVVVNPVTSELLNDVRETANEINELRPFSDDLISSIQRELIGERVYSSNAMEGNTYTLGETIETLKTGHIDLGRKREATEVINLGRAIDFVQSKLLNDPVPFTEKNLLDLHGILWTGINDSIAGRYRDTRVMIRGAKFQPPREYEVDGLMAAFLEQLRSASEAQNVDPIILASWAHWCITRIHPFMDGNGRMARLLQDLVLFRRRLTCAIIPPESKQEYLENLGAADAGGFDSLIQLICRRTAATFDRYIAAKQKLDARSQWARELVGEATERADQKRRLEYERWRRKMDELRYEFERSASTITHVSPDIQIQFKKFEFIDQAAWENIRSGIGARKTWFFQLIFRKQGRAWSYTFFFGKHYWTDVDNDLDKSEPRVCLLINEQIGGQPSVRLDEMTDSAVTLQEVFVVKKTFVRRRFVPDQNEVALDHDISPETIAQDLIREVVLNRIA